MSEPLSETHQLPDSAAKLHAAEGARRVRVQQLWSNGGQLQAEPIDGSAVALDNSMHGARVVVKISVGDKGKL